MVPKPVKVISEAPTGSLRVQKKMPGRIQPTVTTLAKDRHIDRLERYKSLASTPEHCTVTHLILIVENGQCEYRTHDPST